MVNAMVQELLDRRRGGMVPRLYGGGLSPHKGSPREGRTCNRPEHLPWVWGPQTANMWKTWHDIGSAWRTPSGADEGKWPLRCTWDRVMQNTDHNTDHGQILSSGPGAYNFPDMVMMGLPGCTPTEQRAQLSLWVVMGVPLVVSHDLRVRAFFSSCLCGKNKEHAPTTTTEDKKSCKKEGLQEGG